MEVLPASASFVRSTGSMQLAEGPPPAAAAAPKGEVDKPAPAGPVGLEVLPAPASFLPVSCNFSKGAHMCALSCVAPALGPSQPLQGDQCQLPRAPPKLDVTRLYNQPLPPTPEQSPPPSPDMPSAAQEELKTKAKPLLKPTAKPSPKPPTLQKPPARNTGHQRKKLRKLGHFEENA